MNAHAGTLSFTAHAEWIVAGYRAMVLDGRWREAYQSFKEDTDGLTTQMIENILKGSKTLVGITTSEEGVDLIDDTFETGRAYRDNMDDLFGGCVLINRRLFRPTTVVTDYGPNDRLARSGMDPREDFILESYHDKLGKLEVDPHSLIERAKRYAQTKEYIVEFCSFEDRPDSKGKRDLAVIFEPGPDLPFWVRPHRTTQDAVNASHKRLRFTGHEREYGSMKEWLKTNASDAAAATFVKYHEIALDVEPEPQTSPDYSSQIRAILKQNEEGGFGMRTVFFGDRAGAREVPNGPLLQWALARLQRIEAVDVKLPNWKPVNPSGIKLPMDDPSHTDWMMAADLLDFHYHEIGPYMDKLCGDVQAEVLGTKATILVAGKSYAVGAIKFCDSKTEVDADTVAVIKHAGVNYIDIARKAAAVITLNGGSMSHLAINGLSEGFLIVLDPKAREKFAEGNFVAIDAVNGTLELVSECKPELSGPNI